MTDFFKRLDLSHARNVFGVGDIHGHYSVLEEKLSSVNFDPEQDHLICVGDLVDRGPESERCLEFCDKPWFHWVRGNHEELLQVHVETNRGGMKLKNGQKWYLDVMPSRLKTISDTINDAPNILEVLTPSGKRCGFVHAAYLSDDWNDAERVADELSQACLWDRSDIKQPKPNGIKNIDYVFHGHSPLTDPRTVGNVVWIDTGVFMPEGRLTIVRLP